MHGLGGRPCVYRKKKGGLGIKDINNFNVALLGKWKWNLLQHQGKLWAKVVESKYGGWRSIEETRREDLNLFGGGT